MLYTFPHFSRQQNKLPLTVNLLGVHHLQEPVVRRSRFSFYQWLYCEDGIGELNLGGQKYILHPGQIALFFPYEPHAYRAVNEPWYVHGVCFSGSCCEDIMKQLRFSKPGIYHMQSNEIFQTHFSRMMEIQAAQSRDKQAALISLSKECYSFLLDLSLSTEFIPSSLSGQVSETVRILVAYMEEHFSQEITLGLLASQVHLSKSRVSSIFQKELRQPPMQYLTALRIGYARRYLKENPELQVAEIAKMCGYDNPAYFSETFRKIMDMSPREYRLS